MNPETVMEGARLVRRQCPIAEAGDVWIDEALLVCTPGGWISWIGGMIEYEFGPQVSLIAFLLLYFAALWVAWLLAVRVTSPKRATARAR